MFVFLNPQTFDVGINYFVTLSGVNCAARYTTTTITNASLRVYTISTVADVDANNNGLIDSTECSTNCDPLT